MEFLKDWRILIIIYLFLAGIWGVLAKIASTYLNPYTMTFIALTSAWITVSAISVTKLNFHPKFGILLAVVCGCIGGIIALLFYHSLKNVRANIVIPLCALYIVITVILSYFILSEPINIKQIIGIIFGLTAIILLTT